MDDVCKKFSKLTTDPINYHGLWNQGATCYLNSVLQVLFMTKDFREAVERSSDPECIDLQLKDLFKNLKNDRAYTYNITNKLVIDRVYEQRDAAEYYEKILVLTSDEASQIFHGELTHETICSKGHRQKSSDGKFWHLPLELVKSTSETYRVVDGIEEYFRELSLSGENQMYCDQCGDKSDATTKCELKHPPEVLTLLLKRFEFDYYYMRYIKNNCAVDVPFILQIPESHMYELYAVVDHCGDLTSGHYTATVKSQDDDRWYKFDDTRVTLLCSQPFQQTDTERSYSAYLLFYRKKTNTYAHDTKEVSTNGLLPDARVNNAQSQDAEKGREREENKTEAGEDTAEVVSVDRDGKTETRAMVSVECREQELPPKHIRPVELQDNGDGAGQKRRYSDLWRNEERSELYNPDAHIKKLKPTGADQPTPAKTKLLSKYDLFLQGCPVGSAGNHKHNMPEDDGGCKLGGSHMLYEGHTHQSRDVKGHNKMSEADDDDTEQRKSAFTPNTHNLSEGLWDHSEKSLYDVTESRPEQRISVSYPTHTEQAKEQENKVDEHIQNKKELTVRESVEKTSLGNPRSQESAQLMEVVVEDTSRQIHGRIIDEEVKDTPNGLQTYSKTKNIMIVTRETFTKVSIRGQADVGGSTDSSQLIDSPRAEQQTQM